MNETVIETSHEMSTETPAVSTPANNPNITKMFALADRLRGLRDKKETLDEQLKEVSKEIKSVQGELAQVMALAECPGFALKGKQYSLVLKTHWSYVADKKDDLYKVLKEDGYEHLFSVHVNLLNSFIREQIFETADENGETHVPERLLGLVRSYEETSIRVSNATETATKKSK